MIGLSRQQLAWTAERRIWTILLDTDEAVSGLPSTAVTDCARRRVAHLEDLLNPLTCADLDDALERDATQDERDRAYRDAGEAMQATLLMVAEAGESA